ncbi:MAG: Gfo/Idh/MocA family oxidoreductase [Anaerolineae bacterium]|nr:Gfo/Idh/MocA family oxidoreductase [Anaerolineae bacterium]
MQRRKLRVGIIGLGIISDAHVEGCAAMSDIADVVAVCDIDEPKARRVAERFGAAVFTDYRRLIDDADVDLLDIILPHNLHYPVTLYALQRGKHVLLEKPLTVDPDEGLALIEAARAGDVQFSVAENTRFVTAYLEAEKLLRAGALGDIYQIRTLIAGSELERLVNPHPWKASRTGSGGGVIMDASPHTFYLLKWLFGEIEDLQAFASKRVSASEVEDSALIVGRMAGGAEFTLQFSFTALIPWTERLEIYGSKAALIIDQIARPPAILYTGSEDFHGTPLEAVPYDPVRWKHDSIVAEVKDFLQTVWDGGTPKVDPADAHYGLLAIRAAYQSVESGSRVAVPRPVVLA